MKTLLLLGALAIGLAGSEASAASEVDTLRARCAELQRQVRRLESENAKLKAAKAEQASPDARTTADSSAPAKAAATAVEGKTHKIQQGETFASIAKKYHVSTSSLVAANPNVKPTALRPGQVIRLSAHEPAPTPDHAEPAPSKPSPPATPKSQPAAPQPPPATPKPQAAAPPPPPATQKPPVAATTSQPAPAKSPTPAANAPQELSSSPKAGQKTRAITINKEITYGEFAAQHGTDIKRLNELNGLDLTKATVLAKGSEIYVPGQP